MIVLKSVKTFVDDETLMSYTELENGEYNEHVDGYQFLPKHGIHLKNRSYEWYEKLSETDKVIVDKLLWNYEPEVVTDLK